MSKIVADEGNYTYCQSHTILNRYMEISIERSPQHCWPNEGSNSELFDHKNDAVTAGPQRWATLLTQYKFQKETAQKCYNNITTTREL